MMASSLRDHAEIAVIGFGGCTKKAGVPVEASVAAIFEPIWPALADAGDDDPAR